MRCRSRGRPDRRRSWRTVASRKHPHRRGWTVRVWQRRIRGCRMVEAGLVGEVPVAAFVGLNLSRSQNSSQPAKAFAVGHVIGRRFTPSWSDARFRRAIRGGIFAHATPKGCRELTIIRPRGIVSNRVADPANTGNFARAGAHPSRGRVPRSSASAWRSSCNASAINLIRNSPSSIWLANLRIPDARSLRVVPRASMFKS
jgi:hypothetical protein